MSIVTRSINKVELADLMLHIAEDAAKQSNQDTSKISCLDVIQHMMSIDATDLVYDVKITKGDDFVC